MNRVHWIAILATTILGIVAAFQILLAAGLPYGKAAWDGAHRVLPPATLLVVICLVSVALLAPVPWRAENGV